MGGLASTFRRHHRQPAVCGVNVLAEQERRQEKTQPEARDGRGWTALHRAVEAADEAEVRRLLAGGTSVRAADDRGQTSLVAAASAGSAKLCAMLVDAGADVGVRDLFGRTALHAAAEDGGGGGGGAAAAVVELLLRHGADPHAQDGCGRSALHCALRASNLAAAEVLVPAVGPLLLPDDTGKTPLHWAAANGTPEMVAQLMARAGGGGADRDKMGMTPLVRALRERNRQAAHVLLLEARPCEADRAADALGSTVLHWAAYAGYPEVVRHLLDRGFSPWAVDSAGRDALQWAVEGGDRQVIKEILDDRGYHECVDERGQTALHVAAIRGDATITALLMEHGADVGRADSKGCTPLMYALRGAHEDSASVLATQGLVSVRRPDHQKRTLLHWAAVGGDATWKLLAHGARGNAMAVQRKMAAPVVVEHRPEEAAAVLVGANGFHVVRDREGRTALHDVTAAAWSQLAFQLALQVADPQEGGQDMVPPFGLATTNSP